MHENNHRENFTTAFPLPHRGQPTPKRTSQARVNTTSSVSEDMRHSATTLSNPVTQSPEPIYVLLDTGSDHSFIEDELVGQLKLQDVGSEELTITTFSSTKRMENCRITFLQILDQNGAPHTYKVTRVPKITETQQQYKLTGPDRRYLFEKSITLPIDSSVSNVGPQVLFDCAGLFSLLEGGFTTQLALSSELQVVPSRLGYLVTGRMQNDKMTMKLCNSLHYLASECNIFCRNL
ncbi:hypothetical protein GCK32_022865 [Trichostrongylus colubriformis]|uniref:Peptidase aspartic putative domain-containing protein n=1 Tax=Trichostrongylus colubriformis TaxID=6319 RepID=A0AAN8ICU0_TRICO